MALQRWTIFAVALLVRSAIAFLFFGTVDVTNSMGDAESLVSGLRPSDLTVPYLPGMVSSVIWTAGVIGFHTALPVTFLYKFFGCLFDSVIAAMLSDSRGPRAGWLYALAPVSILIVSIHGQWDAISLAFFLAGLLLLRRDGRGAAAGAGALYALSVLAKPITVPFALFFFARKRNAALIGGMAACGVAYLMVMVAVDDPLTLAKLDHVWRYARTGVTYLGLPHAFGVPQHRIAMLAAILLLFPLYWTGRIEREDAVLIGYAYILGTCGLGAQYLAWLVPFLLLRGHFRFAALYSLLAGLYLALFYVSIGRDGSNYVNMGAFAALRGASWLTAGVTHVEAKVRWLIFVGDIAMPLACLAFAFFTVWRGGKGPEPRPASLGPLLSALAITAALASFALLLPKPDIDAYVARIREQVEAYDVIRVAGVEKPDEPTRVLPSAAPLPPKHWLDGAFIAYVWIAAWSGAAYLTGVRARQ